jgi:hypothetical protein
MNTNIRRSLAATGAATILTTLGALATIQPASASPGDPGSPGTLSGNVVHALASADDADAAAPLSPADACAAVDYGEYTGDDEFWQCYFSYDEDKFYEQKALEDVCTGSGGYYDENVTFADHKMDKIFLECSH